MDECSAVGQFEIGEIETGSHSTAQQTKAGRIVDGRPEPAASANGDLQMLAGGGLAPSFVAT